MAENWIRVTGTEDNVEVTTADNETVTVELGGGAGGITIIGRRYDVHRVIIEADKQLSRLQPRWA